MLAGGTLPAQAAPLTLGAGATGITFNADIPPSDDGLVHLKLIPGANEARYTMQISTLGQALDIAEQFPAATVGVVIDTFHVWWDPQLHVQVRRAGRGARIAAYQVCDWITPLPDPLLGRGMMGDGHIDFSAVTRAVLAAGYIGDIEVEIFNQDIWDADPARIARRTVESFGACVGPWVPATGVRVRADA